MDPRDGKNGVDELYGTCSTHERDGKYKFVCGKSEGKARLVDSGEGGRTLLKFVLKKEGVRVRLT